MSEEKRSYRVTSPVKLGKTIVMPGKQVMLTPDEAEGLHVEPVKTGEENEVVNPPPPPPEDDEDGEPEKDTIPKSEEVPDKDQQFVSGSVSAKQAVAHIESHTADQLEGFLSPDEERKTVLDAWQAKHKSEQTDER